MGKWFDMLNEVKIVQHKFLAIIADLSEKWYFSLQFPSDIPPSIILTAFPKTLQTAGA